MKKTVIAMLLVVCLIVGAAAGFLFYRWINGQSKGSPMARPISRTRPLKVEQPEFKESLPADTAFVNQVIQQLSSSYASRTGGSPYETQAMEFMRDRLSQTGYTVKGQDFALPDGAISHNIVCVDTGTDNRFVFLVGAHVDSVAGTPGANDNASGCAAIIELARVLKGTEHLSEIRFVIFGSEEYYKGNKSWQHLGSDYYAAQLTQSELSRVAGMISCDMVAYGSEVHLSGWGPNSQSLMTLMGQSAGASTINVVGDWSQYSDHESFGKRGVPAVWVEAKLPGGVRDSSFHKESDSVGHVDVGMTTSIVEYLKAFLLGLTESGCQSLCSRNASE